VFPSKALFPRVPSSSFLPVWAFVQTAQSNSSATSSTRRVYKPADVASFSDKPSSIRAKVSKITMRGALPSRLAMALICALQNSTSADWSSGGTAGIK
jgi:hypothetical protein